MRILISRLSALGDTVCSLPAAVALKAAFPESHLAWAVDPRFAGIVERCNAVDEVIRVKPGIRPESWPKFDAPFDLALDLQGLAKSALVVARSGAKRRLGYHWQREGAWLVSSAVPPDPTSFHIVDQYVDVARAAIGDLAIERVATEMIDEQGKAIDRGVLARQAYERAHGPVKWRLTKDRFFTHPEWSEAVAGIDRAEFGISADPEDAAKMRDLLREHGITTGFVLINAGAGWASKRWPPHHFATLIDDLARRGIPSALIGGKAEGDRQAAKEVIDGCTHPPADLLGKTSVRELVALVALASAHVGGDTGSTHLAAALSVPAIGLYSITRPQRSCPYGQIGRCHYDPSGLGAIPPNEVLSTVREALS